MRAGWWPRLVVKQQQDRRSGRNTQEMFRQRKISLISKADDLYRFYEAEVFFAIRTKGRYYVYTSSENSSWPPIMKQIVSLLAPVQRERHLKIPQ
jgi:hypothetical protein